jgi:hypothetical protein
MLAERSAKKEPPMHGWLKINSMHVRPYTVHTILRGVNFKLELEEIQEPTNEFRPGDRRSDADFTT